MWSNGMPGSQPPSVYLPNCTARVPVKSSIGEMSSIVSRRPSLMNHSNEERWMSMRLGTSRTFSSLEKVWRTRAAGRVLKSRGLLTRAGGGRRSARRSGAPGVTADDITDWAGLGNGTAHEFASGRHGLRRAAVAVNRTRRPRPPSVAPARRRALRASGRARCILAPMTGPPLPSYADGAPRRRDGRAAARPARGDPPAVDLARRAPAHARLRLPAGRRAGRAEARVARPGGARRRRPASARRDRARASSPGWRPSGALLLDGSPYSGGRTGWPWSRASST